MRMSSLALLCTVGFLLAYGSTNAVVLAQTTPRGGTFDRIYEGALGWQRPPSGQLTPVPQAEQSKKMAAANRGLSQFRDGVQQLYTALQREERYYPGIRPLLGDALNVRAAIESLEYRSRGLREITSLIPDYENLDQLWRTLAYRVKQWPGLGEAVYQRVDAMNVLNEKLASLLKVSPQIQSNELSTLLASMAVDFDRLKGDIEIDLAKDPQRQQYLDKMQRLQTMVYYLRQAVSLARPHDELVGRFQQMHNEWIPIKNALSLVDSRYIRRSITRIAQADDSIHDLLWISKGPVDGDELLATATSLKQSVDQIADQVSLRKLLESPNAPAVFRTVKDFYTLVGGFRQSVATSGANDLDSLRWDFRELDVAWNDVKSALAHSQDPLVLQHIATVNHTVSEIRASIGERPIFDNHESLDLIASIDSLSDLLNSDVALIASSNRYDQNFRTRILRASQTFHRTAHTLQMQMHQNANESAIRQGTLQLVSHWQVLRGLLNQVAFAQPQTMRNVQQIDQALVKLQVNYN